MHLRPDREGRTRPTRPKAFELLWAALRTGFGLDIVDTDTDLDPIRKRPDFGGWWPTPRPDRPSRDCRAGGTARERLLKRRGGRRTRLPFTRSWRSGRRPSPSAPTPQ